MTASIHFGIDGIVWFIICDGKLWIVLVTRLLNCWKLFLFIVFLMLSLFRHMPTRWNMFLMGFRIRNRGSILNNLQAILSWAFFNILEFWERSLSCKNSCTFGLLPLLKLLQNLSVTNSEHNSRLMFFFIQKAFTYASAMGKGNHNLDHMSSNLLPLTLATACIPNTTLRRSFFLYDSLVSLLVGIDLSCGPSKPHKDRRISLWSRRLRKLQSLLGDVFSLFPVMMVSICRTLYWCLCRTSLRAQL